MASTALARTGGLGALDERLCRLVAAGEKTQVEIARAIRRSLRTVERRIGEPHIIARIAELREQFRAEAMRDAAFADKRARIVARDAVARDLLRQLRDSKYEAVIGLREDGTPIIGFDKERARLLDQYLNSIAAELDEARSAGIGVGVAVKVYLDPRMDRPLEADWDDAPPPRNRPDW